MLEGNLVSVLADAFPFEGERCDRLSETVLERLGDTTARRVPNSPGRHLLAQIKAGGGTNRSNALAAGSKFPVGRSGQK